MVQWCNTADTGPAYRMDRKFKLVWLKSGDSEEEHYAMNAQPGWLPCTWVITLQRVLTPSFRFLAHGKLPPPVKAIIKSKFEAVDW